MAEIQTTISTRELDLWGKFRRKFGPLNPVRMYDAGPALISSILSNAHGGKAKPYDFMPYGREVDSSGDDIVDADKFIQILKSHPKSRVFR